MLACGKYDLVHEYYKRLLGSSVPNALTYKGIYAARYIVLLYNNSLNNT